MNATLTAPSRLVRKIFRESSGVYVIAELSANHNQSLAEALRLVEVAAETGAEAARHAGRLPPLGLLLTPDNGGAQGIESRWHMAAAPSGSTLTQRHSAWVLQRLRARMAPEARFHLSRRAADASGPAVLEAKLWPDHSPS